MGKKAVPDIQEVVEEVLDLYQNLLIPFMKVRRDITFPTELDRKETDSEHTFTLVMIAITVAHRLKLNLDMAKVTQYALVHDLVEAHAGDVSARSTDKEQQIKVDREHEAFMVIKERFAKKTPWIVEWIEAYEARADEESKFIYALDKQSGYYNYLSGSMPTWRTDYPKQSDYHRTSARLRKKASAYPKLMPMIDALHDILDNKTKDLS